jgi:hypothetical protein
MSSKSRSTGSNLAHRVLLENIEAMRRQAGIDDSDLKDAIGRLVIGDHVRVTLRSDESTSCETAVLRITEIGRMEFRGVLTGTPTTKGLTSLRAGFLLAFTTEHIHSLPNARKADIERRSDRAGRKASTICTEENHG